MIKNTINHYGIITKLFHWLIALCIIVQILMGFFLDALGKNAFFIHKSMGLTLLFLATLFILWSLFNRKPLWPKDMPTWERAVAHLIQWLLYAAIFFMPLSGWFMSTAEGYPPSFWGLFTLPAPFFATKAYADFFDKAHYFLAWTIVVLVSIHLLGALKHRLIDRDDVLQKML